MSLINNAHAENDIETLCVLFETLSVKKSIALEVLRKYCMPKEMYKPGSANLARFERVIKYWGATSRSLWVVDEHDCVSLRSNHGVCRSRTKIGNQVRNSLMCNGVPEYVLEVDKGRLEFMKVISALYFSDVFTAYQEDVVYQTSSLEEFLRKGFGNNIKLNDDARLGLIRYASFMGFIVPVSTSGYQFDITRILKEFVSEMYKSKAKIKAKKFFAEFEQYCHILSVDFFDKYVRPDIKKSAISDYGDLDQVPRSFCHAMERLEQQGIVILETFSDDMDSVPLRFKHGEKVVSAVMVQK